VKLIERKNSILTGKDNLENLVTLKKFPVFLGCTDQDIKEDIFADMVWKIDPETGIIQLTELIPLEIIYQSQHVDGIGNTWESYYENFASFITEHKHSNVLEIGGGQGRLAEKVISKGKNIKWTIVEPNPTYNGEYKIKLISSFFDDNFKTDEKFDTIVFSQVLEHSYDPQIFLKKIFSILSVGGKLIFAYPNIELWVRRKYTNSVNFEHTVMLTDFHLDYMLTKNGFNIIEKVQYLDHSIYYVVEKSENIKIIIPKNKYLEYKEIFMSFISSYYHIVEEINRRIRTTDSPIYLFGAHIFTQYLLSFGLNRSKIISILDNSKLKQGKRLYGTDLFVESPEVLREQESPIVILKAGIYNEEIKKDVIENINPTVIFWE